VPFVKPEFLLSCLEVQALDLILNYRNSIHTLKSYFLTIYFNVLLPFVSSFKIYFLFISSNLVWCAIETTASHRLVHVGHVGKMALEQIFLRVFPLYPIGIISTMLPTNNSSTVDAIQA
jgi:hypothetical protein